MSTSTTSTLEEAKQNVDKLISRMEEVLETDQSKEATGKFAFNLLNVFSVTGYKDEPKAYLVFFAFKVWRSRSKWQKLSAKSVFNQCTDEWGKFDPKKSYPNLRGKVIHTYKSRKFFYPEDLPQKILSKD